MTEYMIDNGPGAGVQDKKEGAIMEDDQPADLDSILDRIAPGKREAFLKSRARLMDKGDAELLAIVLHLDNFASVIDGLTIGLSPRSENAREAQGGAHLRGEARRPARPDDKLWV